MNKLPLTLLLTLSCYSLSATAQTSAPLFPALSKTLDSLAAVQQEPRRELLRRSALPASEQKQLAPRDFGAEQLAISARHQPLLEAIVRQYGYPGFQQVGETSARNLAQLVQHADPRRLPFQRRVLRLLKVEVVRRNASPDDAEDLAERLADNARLRKSRQASNTAVARRPTTPQPDHERNYADWVNSTQQQQMTSPPVQSTSVAPAFGMP